jgi:hypothetical protein
VKGALLVLIGLSEASKTLIDDVTHGQLRVGHGLIIIELFGILDAVPHLIEGVEAGKRYLDLRQDRSRPESGPDDSPPYTS